jgi:hypothetical protein
MSNRKWLWAVCGVAMTAMSVVPRVDAVATNAQKTTYLTFNRPVQLPGVALNSGTYIFEVANPETSANIVRVVSRDRSIAYFMGFTTEVARPRNMRRDQLVSLGEAAAGSAPRITAWWPEGEAKGRQFIYLQ